MSSIDSTETQPSTPVITEAIVIERLKACQSLLLEFVSPLLANIPEQLVKSLIELEAEAKTNQEQAHLFEQQKLFKRNWSEIERYFLGYLGEGFIKFKRGDLDTSTGEEDYDGDMLSLVDNEDLEETIAVSSITHRAENQYLESIWALNQRLAVLVGGKKVNDRSNPAGPVQYCESLRKALTRAPLETKTKILAYRTFEKEVMLKLAGGLESLNTYLKDNGILPDLQYRPSSNTAPPTAQVEEVPFESWDGAELVSSASEPQPSQGFMPAPDASLPPEQYQGRLVSAIRSLQSRIASTGGDASTPVAPGSAVTNPGPMGAASTGVLPTAGGGMTGGIGEHYSAPGGSIGAAATVQGAPVAAAGSSGQVATDGVTGVVSNRQMIGVLTQMQGQGNSDTADLIREATPELLQPQQASTVGEILFNQLRIEAETESQAVDPTDLHTIDLVGMLFEYMLSDDNLPDSVKALLSYLHTPYLKVAFIDKDFFEQTEHPARMLLNNMAEAGVKWISNDGSSQYDIYDKIKHVVSTVLEDFESDVRLFAELLLDFSAYTKKLARRQELVEKRAAEKVQGEEKLREVKLRVNEEVKQRIDGRELPSAVLLMLLQPWSDYLAFLLLRYGHKSEGWLRAVRLIDDVLWSIEPKTSNEDKTAQLEMTDRLLDSLENGFETIGYDQAKKKKLVEALVSLQKMALQSKQVEPAPEAMRAKLERIAAEKVGKSPDHEDAPTVEEQRMIDNLKMIEFGTWFEFEGGRRLKVAWYNSKTSHYMLVDQMGKKVAMKSGLELARDLISKQAKVIAGSSKPFFERALENIFQSLNTRADDLGKEDENE